MLSNSFINLMTALMYTARDLNIAQNALHAEQDMQKRKEMALTLINQRKKIVEVVDIIQKETNEVFNEMMQPEQYIDMFADRCNKQELSDVESLQVYLILHTTAMQKHLQRELEARVSVVTLEQLMNRMKNNDKEEE